MPLNINVIDLFAGPGGLGEGFSTFTNKGKYPFHIKLSVEMDKSAHKTLTLRSFYRKFRGGDTPEEYYEYLRNPELTTEYLKEKYPDEWRQALEETLQGPKELGTEDDEAIFEKLHKIRKKEKAPFVVIGGPPCQAYSVMGRIKNNSLDDYDETEDHRHHLYKDYLRVLDVIEPEIFVMENVRGILTSKYENKRIFPLILRDLKCPSQAINQKEGTEYAIYSLSHLPEDFIDDLHPQYSSDQDFVIKAEKHGIPQTRHRVILLGIRRDIAEIIQPDILETHEDITTNQMLDSMPRIRSAVSRQKDDADLWKNTVITEGEELAKILSNNNQPKIAKKVLTVVNALKLPRSGTGNKRFVSSDYRAPDCSERLKQFIKDENLKGYLNHFARSHMKSDLQRYLFCAIFAKVNKKRKIPSPHKNDFPEELAPDHKSWKSGKFADRFRVQFRGRAASTITSHINRDGHYFIHYDPSQCRSLSVREAARIQTFPDNYFFEGNQTQQFIQVGNAVPPFLAQQIAGIVYTLIK